MLRSLLSRVRLPWARPAGPRAPGSRRLQLRAADGCPPSPRPCSEDPSLLPSSLLTRPWRSLLLPLQAAPAAEQAAGRAWWKLGTAAAAGGAGLAAASSIALADEAEHGLHAPAYPWPHDGFFRWGAGWGWSWPPGAPLCRPSAARRTSRRRQQRQSAASSRRQQPLGDTWA